MELATFIAQFELWRDKWNETLARVPTSEMTRPMQAGGWTVKDIIAHNTWHEREMVELISQHTLAGSEWWLLPTDERNQHIYEAYFEQPLAAVLADADGVSIALQSAIGTLTEADLNDPARFRQMPPEWQPWLIMAQNTYEHYKDHIVDIEAWLDTR